jgi:hypothetical protein
MDIQTWTKRKTRSIVPENRPSILSRSSFFPVSPDDGHAKKNERGQAGIKREEKKKKKKKEEELNGTIRSHAWRASR